MQPQAGRRGKSAASGNRSFDAPLAKGFCGMVGGFAAAGVKYVISCLWTADDFASAVLMAEFYRQYKDRKLSPPAALRAAKKYLRRVTIQELAEKNWFDIALKNGELSSEARDAVLVLSNMPPKFAPFNNEIYWAGLPASGATEGGIEMEQREQMTTSIRNANSTLMPLSNGRTQCAKRSWDIRSAYEEFMEKGDIETRDFLIEKIMTFCRMRIKRLAYHTEAKVKQADIEDVVGISCLTMLEELEKRRSENKYIENIMGFISIVCSNKFADRQRELYKLKDPETGEGYIPISLETPREDGTTLGSNIGGNPHYEPWDDARRQFAATAVLIYVKAFLSLEVPPQSSLALFYARLLPHIRGSVDDNKTTSVSEAFRVMGKKTVETLADESEREIKENFLKSLGWSKYFRTHLDDEMTTDTGNVPLRKIVYTEKFTTSETEHRSTAVHKICVKKVSEIVRQNKELIKSAEDFIPEYMLARDGEVKPSILYKAFTGGRV